MGYLLTEFGTTLYRGDDKLIRHGRLSSVTTPLDYEREPLPALQGTESGFSLKAQEGFLAAAANGGFSPADGSDPATRLYPATSAQLADLTFLFANRWVELRRGAVANWETVRRPDAIVLRLGELETSLPELLESLALLGGGGLRAEKSLSLRHDGWRWTRLLLYRPLAWYAAFGSPDAFACLTLAVTSLFEFGQWSGEVLVITDSAHADLKQQFPEAWRDRIHLAFLAPKDMLEYTLGRYEAVNLDLPRICQPLLYLDIDVVANAPLQRLVAELLTCETLCVCPEGMLGAPEDYYGASLLAAEGTQLSGRERGFTSGLMGMRRIEAAERAFRMTLATAATYPPLVKNRTLGCHDQPVMNYVAYKLGLPLDGRLAAYVTNVWYWKDRPEDKRGLSHFTGGVHGAAAKRERMEAYVSELRAAAGPSAEG